MYDNLSVRVHFDSDSKRLVKFFRTKSGKVCRYAFIDTSNAKRIGGYISIDNDLKNSLEAFQCLNALNIDPSNDTQVIKRSLMVNAVVTYMKCFTQSDGRKIKLEGKDIFKSDTILINQHNKLSEFRHQYLAHSGKSKHEEISIVAILNPDETKKKIFDIDIGVNSTTNIDTEVPICIDLVRFVRKHVNEKINKLMNLFQIEISDVDLIDLYNNSVLPDERYFIYLPIDRPNLQKRNSKEAEMEIKQL